jgi:hypothetical protein
MQENLGRSLDSSPVKPAAGPPGTFLGRGATTCRRRFVDRRCNHTVLPATDEGDERRIVGIVFVLLSTIVPLQMLKVSIRSVYTSTGGSCMSVTPTRFSLPKYQNLRAPAMACMASSIAICQRDGCV